MQHAILPDAGIRFKVAGRQEEPLWRLYDRAYDVSLAESAAAATEAFALRYQVYCIERGFEDPSGSPLGLERDAFDHRSVHVLLRHRETRIPVGTARLILPDERRPWASWPIQQVCRDPRLFGSDDLPSATTAEVSRFCLSVDARGRVQQAREAGTCVELSEEEEARLAPFTILGTIRGLLQLSLRQGITHWALIVEPALLRLLGRLGLHFTKLGPVVEYHGRRQPCCSDLFGLFERMREQRPDLWRIVTASGSLAPQAPAGRLGRDRHLAAAAAESAGNLLPA